MKLAVIGSRDGLDTTKVPVLIEKVLENEKIGLKDLVIVSGGARGVDTSAEFWASENGVKTQIFLADWKNKGKGAGYIRNVDIISNCDIVLAFWNNTSRGTAHSLSLARKMRKRVWLANPNLHIALPEELPEHLNYKTIETADRLDLFRKAIDTWGIESQVFMVMEETGEMLNALAKANRGRSTKEEIITELADVHIMMEQMAVYFGYEDYLKEIDRKLKRLEERLR